MTRNERDTNPFDPTAERAADPAVPAENSPGGTPEGVVNRDYEDTTPRRYEKPVEDNPTLPDEPALRTEI